MTMEALEKHQSEGERRSEIIIGILDIINPIPENADDATRQAVDLERQILVTRAGWTSMPLEKLEKLAHE